MNVGIGGKGCCRYPRTGVPPLAVSRQEPCSYPWLRPNSRTPEVRSPVSLDNDPGPVSQLEKSGSAACPGRGWRSDQTAGGPDLP